VVPNERRAIEERESPSLLPSKKTPFPPTNKTSKESKGGAEARRQTTPAVYLHRCRLQRQPCEDYTLSKVRTAS